MIMHIGTINGSEKLSINAFFTRPGSCSLIQVLKHQCPSKSAAAQEQQYIIIRVHRQMKARERHHNDPVLGMR